MARRFERAQERFAELVERDLLDLPRAPDRRR
jgi:hypothetical protein